MFRLGLGFGGSWLGWLLVLVYGLIWILLCSTSLLYCVLYWVLVSVLHVRLVQPQTQSDGVGSEGLWVQVTEILQFRKIIHQASRALPPSHHR